MPRRLPRLPKEVTIREVGPRDGLQSESPIAPARRAELATALIEAGCLRVEAASFVSERAVPAMAGGAEVIAALDRSGVAISALVPNLRGAEDALASGVDELTVTVAASESYNHRNVARTISDSLTEISRVCTKAADSGVPVDGVLSCAFGSPYEGDIPAKDIAAICSRLAEAGVAAITLADTTGMATPRVLDEVTTELGAAIGGELLASLGLHLHDTRETALVNAYAGLQLGISRFDSSIGGLGGSPFAAGAGGNLATEDFVAFLDDLGVATGIDLDRLLLASELAERLVGHDLPSKVAKVGARTRLAAAEPETP
ncbi:MAG: hydroxymethylglutaryl-CoA lyase, partial [Acidimicrobiales bacterium]